MDNRPYGILPCTEPSLGGRVKRYRERAETLREIADEIVVEPVQKILLQVANTYDVMAQDTARLH